MKNPLIELAEELEYDALRKARILRAAAAVIETTALWLRTGEGSPNAIESSLRAYEAACREEP